MIARPFVTALFDKRLTELRRRRERLERSLAAEPPRSVRKPSNFEEAVRDAVAFALRLRELLQSPTLEPAEVLTIRSDVLSVFLGRIEVDYEKRVLLPEVRGAVARPNGRGDSLCRVTH